MAAQLTYNIVIRAEQAKDLATIGALKACQFNLSESVFGALMRVYRIPGADQSPEALRTFVGALRTQYPQLDVRVTGMSIPD